jgi:hypothetical protein
MDLLGHESSSLYKTALEENIILMIVLAKNYWLAFSEGLSP